MTAFSMHQTNRNEVRMAMHECGLMGESLNGVDENLKPHVRESWQDAGTFQLRRLTAETCRDSIARWISEVILSRD